MGSDWDYINEHMGGHDEDGLPNFMSEPGFGRDDELYDWKQKSRDNGRKTLKEWNLVGRSIKKGEKGKWSDATFTRCVFSESQTTIDSFINREKAPVSTEQAQFQTYEEAVSWSKANPGRTITRSPDGNGFIIKK